MSLLTQSSSATAASSVTDPRAQFWGKAVKALAVVFGFAILGPVFWAAFGGAVGACLCALTWWGTYYMRHWWFMKAANIRLKAIRSEAARNPVETLREEHRRQSVQLEDRKKGVEQLGGAIRTLDQTIDALQAEFPDSPELPQLREDQAELELLHQSRSEEWQAAYVSLGEFDREITRVSRLWEVSLAAARARQQSGLTEEEWMGKLKTQTSLDAIRTNLNTQLAALNTERMQTDAQRILKGKVAAKALPAGTERPVINVTNTAASKARA